MPSPFPAATIRTHVTVPMRYADGFTTKARVFTFDGLVDGRQHLAFGLGDRAGALDSHRDGRQPPLVRPHSECLTGDVFGSERCDCGPQMREAVERITHAGGHHAYMPQGGAPRGRSVPVEPRGLGRTGLVAHEGAPGPPIAEGAGGS